MTQALLDPCLFFKQEKKELIGMIATLVDDSLGLETRLSLHWKRQSQR